MSQSRYKRASIRNWSNIFSIFGRRCMICGLESEHPIYHLHHHDQQGKETNLGKIMHHSWEKVEKEVRKCILVCANCHAIVHDIERKRKK